MAEQEGETPSRGGPHWPHWIRFDRFSWLDLGVFAVSEGVALPLCIAAGDAFVHRDWIGAAIGWGPGLPLFVFGVAFPFSRHWLRPETRELFQRRAINWAPVVISLAFLYVVGPAIVRRTVPSSPTSDEIAKTVAREIKPLLAKQSRPQPTVAPQPDLVKNILIYPDDNNFSVFRCEFNTSSAGKRMRIFLDYEFRGMSETTWSKMVRFPLYDLRDYFRDQKASFVVLRRHQYQSSYKTKQFTAWDFRFGDDKAPEDNSSYILGIEYRTRLAFVNKNGDEQYNYFYILNWKDAHNAETFKPKIVTTDIISPMLNWSGQRGQARGLAPASP